MTMTDDDRAQVLSVLPALRRQIEAGPGDTPAKQLGAHVALCIAAMQVPATEAVAALRGALEAQNYLREDLGEGPAPGEPPPSTLQRVASLSRALEPFARQMHESPTQNLAEIIAAMSFALPVPVEDFPEAGGRAAEIAMEFMGGGEIEPGMLRRH